MQNIYIQNPKLLFWGVFSYLILTTSVLSILGYESLMNANPVFKLGVGPLLLIFAFFAYFKFIIIDKCEKWMFVLIVIMLFVNVFIKGEYQITNYVSAIIFPVCLSCLLGTYRKNAIVKRKIQKIVLVFFYMECALAVIERILKFHLFGAGGDDETSIMFMESYEFRSCALYGHPLSNSAILTFLLPFLLLNNSYSVKKRNILWGIGMLALLCFNSRLSIVCSVALYFLINYKDFFHSRHKTSLLIGMITIVCIFFYMLFFTPLGGRLVNMGLYGEDSSSLARTDILDIFNYVDINNYIFIGVPFDQIKGIQRNAGVDYLIIENPWIIFFFRYGLVQTIAMVVFYIPIFKKWLANYGTYYAVIISVFFLIIISSSNSLAVGNTAIAMLFLFAYAFSNDNITNSFKHQIKL